MSAYMHDPAHIDALVTGALRYAGASLSWRVNGEWVTLTPHDRSHAQRVGKMLLRENAESMAYRYDMKDLDNDADGGTRPVEYLEYLSWADEYEYDADDTGKPWRFLPPVALLKALASYEYQSCEHPEWEASAARSFCQSLRLALINALPGYDAADTWSIHPKEGQPA